MDITQLLNGVALGSLLMVLSSGLAMIFGLRGVAKVYGERRPLIFWMVRRPLGTLRQKVGL